MQRSSLGPARTKKFSKLLIKENRRLEEEIKRHKQTIIQQREEISSINKELIKLRKYLDLIDTQDHWSSPSSDSTEPSDPGDVMV